MGVLDDYYKAKAKRLANNQVAPLRQSSAANTFPGAKPTMRNIGDVAPVLTRATTKEDEDKLDFFQKGVFDDGYQFGDVTKAILGTTGDAALNVAKGAGSLVEGLVDLVDYGIAGGADLLGYDDYADRLRKVTSESLIDKGTKGVSDWLDQYSVLGNTSDSVMQGIGQVGGIILTGGLGSAAGLSSAGVSAMTTGVMGLSSFGSGMGEAYQSGATDEEAATYGLIKGVVDAGSELIFGGLGKTVKALGLSKGLTSLDDVFAQKLSSKITNQVAKNFVEYGVKASAEGVEEVLAGIGTAVGKKLTYMNDKELSELVKDENLLEQFVVGAVTSGVSQSGLVPGMKGGSLKEANETGRDFVSGLSNNEQKVIDKVFEDLVAEQDGKLNERQKTELYDKVLADMEKGYIDVDTIEKVLGDNSAYDSLLKESEEFKTLYETESGKLSERQKDRLAELKKKNEANPYETALKSAKGQLSENVFTLVQGDRLVESYNERARRGQKFEADLTKYDKKYHTTIQNAINSGTLNNSNRTHELVDFIAKISADKGVPFDFTNNEKIKGTQFAVEGKIVNGYKTDSGITLNVQSPKYLETTVGHEITHVLEGTEFYDALSEAVKNYAISKEGMDGFNARLKAVEELYKGVKDADPDGEVVADLVGEYVFSDTDFVNKLSTENRNVFQKVYDEIKYLCKVVTAGSKEARQLEKVKKAFEEAYRANGKPHGEGKYSISETNDGRYAAVVDSDILSNIDTTSWDNTKKSEAKKAAAEALKQFKDGIVVDGITHKVNKVSRREYTRSNYTESLYSHAPDVFADKMRAAEVADDIVVAATNWQRDGGLKHPRTDDFVDFDRGKTLIVSGNSKYSAEVVVGITAAGDAVFYDVVDMTPTTFDIKKEESPTTATTQNAIGDIQGDSFDNNVAQNGKDVKLSLSAEQQNYFKDSKVRDENGNLKVMYHGTPNGDFTVFKDGTYFTDNKAYADTYQNPGASSISTGKTATNPKTFEVYLDIKKPFDITDAEARDIYINDYIKGGNAMGINPYLSDAEYDKIQTIDWTEGEDLREFLIDNGYDYDGLVLDEGGTGGYGDEVQSRGKSYVVFSPEQVKNIDNLNPTNDADIRYSLSDSDGKQLTQEQSEYFKDSKVRDDNGNLMVLYHGTPHNFTVFDLSRSGENYDGWSEYGEGIYLTPDKKAAQYYADNAGLGKDTHLMELYADVKKPFNTLEAVEFDISEYVKKYELTEFDERFLKGAGYRLIDFLKTHNESVYECLSAHGYDGIWDKDSSGYVHQIVCYEENQIKNTTNLKPTKDVDIRFSLSQPVEETKDLMALHNLTGEKLLKSLKLGGLPMPSVAIAKAKDGHSEFGEISLVLPKETIDPQSSSRNKLYSGDAWTPTYPKVEYKPSDKVLRDARNKVNALVPNKVQDVLGYIGLDADNARDSLDRYNGNMVEAFKQNDTMKYAYLKDTGSDISLPMKEEDLVRYGDVSNSAVRYFSGKLVNGLQTVEMYQNMSARDLLQDEALTEAVADALNFDVLRTLEPGSEEYKAYERDPVFRADEVTFRDIDRLLSGCRKLFTNGVQQTVDRRAAKELVRDAVDQTAYESWLGDLFSGVVEKEGIRNNKDYFTPSGNRRSFEALHYEHNLENVIKAMREKGEKGIGFGGGNIFGAATTEFSSVEDMKKSSDRLQHMSEEEYQKIKDGFSNRFFELASSLPKNKNSFSATDDAATALTEAVAKYQTRSGIANYLKRELKGWANYSDHVVDDLIELVQEIRNMPTGYFEAKPQRAVSFDEVGVFVIPYDADVKLKQELLNNGYAIAEYDPKVEGDRTRVLNQFEEYKFSLSNVGEAPRGKGTLGKDIAYVDPNAVAPIADNTDSNAENVLANAESNTERVADMFPDEPTPQTELNELLQEREALEERMLKMSEAGDWSELESVNDRYVEVSTRVAELENEISESEAGRVNSLDDADVPPEMDAPIFQKSENYNPYSGVTLADINRSTRTYSDRNPGARRFIEEGALGFLYDINNSTHGERWYNDELYYASGGEKGFGGTSRLTTADIADMKDTYGYSWDALRKAAEDVVKGEVRSVAAKRIEYLIHKRLMEGYTDVDGRRYEPNQEYISFLNETFANEQRAGSIDNLLENAEQYAPEEIAPVKPLAKATPDTMTAPLYQSKDPNAVKGQTSLLEPPKPNPQVATVLTEEKAVQKEKPGVFGKLVSALVDKGRVFESLSLEKGNHEIQAKWNYALPSNTEARAQYFMENGADGVKPLKDIRKAVDKSGKTDQFYDYMYHVHNIDRMTLEDRFDNTPNKTVFGETVTADVSRQKVRQYEARNPEFKQWAEDVYAFNKHLRNLLVENGVISQETANLWEKMYPHYVPIRRVDSKGLNVTVPLDTNKTGVNAPIKRATGGSSDIMPLFETMAMRAEQTYRAIARNSFGIELKNTLGTTLDSQSNTSVDEMIDTIEAQEDHLLKPGTMNSNPTFTVFENGERVEFEITEDMYDALKPAGDILGHRNKALTTVSDWRRNLLTTWNPVFALYRNPIKDLQDVAINSQHAVKTYLNIPNAIFQLATDGKWATEYHRSGGKSNTYFDSQKNQFKAEDNILKKTIGLPVRAVEAAGEFIEEIPRLAEYIASRQSGRSVERSMLDAARVTTNFAAGGDFTKFLNSHGFTFLNASVQGAAQHVRNFREATKQDGLKGFTKTLAKYVVAGLPGMLLNSLMWDDDEDYEELSDYVKQNYYVVAKTEDGKFVRIPKGRTAAVMHECMEQMQNLVTGDDEADFSTFHELFWNNIAPNNPLENNILAPIGQTLSNKAWYGGDLVPSRLQDLPAAEQFDESTDSISKWLGEATNTSPYKWNYLIDQYSGGLGDVFLPMMTPEAESGDNSPIGNILAPWKKEITTDKVLNNKNPGDFYDLKDELEKLSNSKNATDEDRMRTMYMDSVSWDMGDLYAKKREIQSSDLPDDEKYEEVRKVQEQINELAKNALSGYNDVHIDGLYSEVGDRRYNQDAETGKWYEIHEKNADGSDNYYYQQEQKVTKGLGITYGEYWNNREEYDYAYNNPEKYTFSKAVGGYQSFRGYTSDLWDIKADKDENGKSISGSRKEKVIDYINGLDADYGERIILFKSEYPADDTYNQDIIDYLNSRDDISYEEMVTILKYLEFEVDSEGYIYWD